MGEKTKRDAIDAIGDETRLHWQKQTRLLSPPTTVEAQSEAEDTLIAAAGPGRSEVEPL